MPTLSKEKVIPAHAKKASASTPNVEIRGISSDTPAENLRNLKTFSPKELPILSESPAISRQNKSLMAFYALKGDGEMTEVSFSSTLSTPNSADVKRTASIQIPADGKIRMVPLFFSADVTENYPPGEYRMSWSVKDPKTGGYAMVSAFFSKVSKSESGTSSFRKAPFEKSADSLPRPAPPESNFDKKGVGVIPKSTPSYKFNIPTPSSKKPKK